MLGTWLIMLIYVNIHLMKYFIKTYTLEADNLY